MLEVIKSFETINEIKKEFYEKMNETKSIIQNYSKHRYTNEISNS